MTHWWQGAVIYQIYPRSFADSNGDGVGDLQGVVDKLSYVADLGVDGIWLSPFFTSPMKDFGYDVSDYRDVDPVFGTLEDFDRLLERAHALGLKVIIDQVYSHTSDDHPWFAESRRSRSSDMADWYVWADAREDGSPPNNWLSVFGGPAWTWDTRRRQYYLHNFLAEQPDLNFHNRAVQDAILDVAKFWLERGVDGFRLDVANYYFHDPALRDNPPSGQTGGARPYLFQRHLYNRSRPENIAFLERLRALLDTYDARMSVAEISSQSNIQRSIEYTRSKRLHTAYNFHFLEASQLDPLLIREAFDPWEHVEAWPSWSLSNHDVVRSVSRWSKTAGTPSRAKMLTGLLLALRGTIFLYQGEELGLPQADVPFEKLQDPEAIRFWPDNLGRDGCRTPMPWAGEMAHAGFSDAEPWLPVSEHHRALAVDRQLADAQSCLAYVRQFLAMRRRHGALQRGDIVFRAPLGDVLLFERRAPGETVLCGFNLSDEASAEIDLSAEPALSMLGCVCQGWRYENGRGLLDPNGCFLAIMDGT